MWRKALLATVLLIIISFILSNIRLVLISSVVDGATSGGSSWLTDIGWTVGTIVAVASYAEMILNAIVTFLVIWWTLHSTIGQSPSRKVKEDSKVKNYSVEALEAV